MLPMCVTYRSALLMVLRACGRPGLDLASLLSYFSPVDRQDASAWVFHLVESGEVLITQVGGQRVVSLAKKMIDTSLL